MRFARTNRRRLGLMAGITTATLLLGFHAVQAAERVLGVPDTLNPCAAKTSACSLMILGLHLSLLPCACISRARRGQARSRGTRTQRALASAAEAWVATGGRDSPRLFAKTIEGADRPQVGVEEWPAAASGSWKSGLVRQPFSRGHARAH